MITNKYGSKSELSKCNSNYLKSLIYLYNGAGGLRIKDEKAFNDHPTCKSRVIYPLYINPQIY